MRVSPLSSESAVILRSSERPSRRSFPESPNGTPYRPLSLSSRMTWHFGRSSRFTTASRPTWRYFQAGNDVNFIALTGDSNTPHTIYHEYVHSLTKEGKSPLPLWAGEGLAEFYSTLETEAGGKEVLVGKPVSEHIAP